MRDYNCDKATPEERWLEMVPTGGFFFFGLWVKGDCLPNPPIHGWKPDWQWEMEEWDNGRELE